MNSYELSRNWFDWCFDNPEKIKPVHTAIYFFSIEHCNRLGWMPKFGLPTEMVKSAIGVHSYNTYIDALNDLVEWGFIKMIQKSKNQYSSNIIALSNFDKATTKALDKAMIKHSTKHSTKQDESIDSINKQVNKEQINNETIPSFDIFFEYVKTLKSYKQELDYAVKVKYNNWVDNKWRDGNNDEIKNWKNKIMNTMAYMKVIVDPNKPIDLAEYFKNRL
jgi:hypothetical protein